MEELRSYFITDVVRVFIKPSAKRSCGKLFSFKTTKDSCISPLERLQKEELFNLFSNYGREGEGSFLSCFSDIVRNSYLKRSKVKVFFL